MPPDEGEALAEGRQISCKIVHEVNFSSGVGGVLVSSPLSIAWMAGRHPSGV